MPEEACESLLAFLLEDEEALRRRLDEAGALAPFLDPLPSWVGETSAGRADPAKVAWHGLLGGVLWETFSNNNEVAGPDGRLYDLGSWRGSGTSIADFLNRRLVQEDPAAQAKLDALGRAWPIGPFGYLDFYMGLMVPEDDEERGPGLDLLYRHVFERLKARGCTWRYASPAIYLVRLDRPEKSADPADYDPSAAALEELEAASKEEAADELARDLARGNEEAYRRAVEHPPRIVRAYRDVYGELPPYVRPGA